MASQITRLTLFKLANAEAALRFESLFTKMFNTHSKNGKPYILSLEAGPTDTVDPRSQGYTFACKTTFTNLEDMKYYDEECAAHQKLRSSAKEEALLAGPLLMVYFPSSVVLAL